MVKNNELATSLEQLLENLIIMVGRSNQQVDSLKRRVAQLEYLVKEQQLKNRPKEFILQTPIRDSLKERE